MNDEALAVAIMSGLASRFEGVFLKVYLCPARVPTIGIGSTFYEDGTPVRMTDPPITEGRAVRLLMHSVMTIYLPAVKKLCPRIDTPGRLAAILDFCYNLGAGNLQASTLRKYINAGLWAKVPDELMKWVKGGGVVLPGLKRRRIAEAQLI